MIDTAGSVCTLMDELIKRKIQGINIIIIHALFSRDASLKLKSYHDKGYLKKIIVSNTIEITPNLKKELPFLEVVNTTKLVAEIIVSLSESVSLSPFLEPFSANSYFDRLEAIE